MKTDTPSPLFEEMRQNQPARVIAGTAGKLQLKFDIERMFSVHHRTLAARRASFLIVNADSALPLGSEQLKDLSLSIWKTINRRALARAKALLEDGTHQRISVVITLSAHGITDVTDFYNVLVTLSTMTIEQRQRLVLELLHLDNRFSHEQIVEMINLLIPFCQAVFGRVLISPHTLHLLRDTKLSGTTIDITTMGKTPTQIAASILAYSEVGKQLAASMAIGTLSSETLLDVCRIAGITHAIFSPTYQPSWISEDTMTQQTTPLHHLIYFSKSTLDPQDNLTAALDKITATAVARNKSLDVTGALLYCDGYFIQVLEGPRTVVNELYKKISRDSRHSDVEVIESCPIKTREFAKWNMTSLIMAPDDQAVINTFAERRGFDPSALTNDSAMTLLRAVSRMKEEEERAA